MSEHLTLQFLVDGRARRARGELVASGDASGAAFERAGSGIYLLLQGDPAYCVRLDDAQADKDALENVIELVRKQKAGDATQVQATISDPVARKLAEWLILRSDNNNASVER